MPIISSWSDRTKLRSSDIQVDIIFLMRSIAGRAEKAGGNSGALKAPFAERHRDAPISLHSAAGARLRASL